MEAAPLSLLVGVLVHSGRRFLSLLFLSLFYASLATTIYFPISYGCLMCLFSCCGLLSFLLRSGLSLFLSPRLLPLLVWHEAVPSPKPSRPCPPPSPRPCRRPFLVGSRPPRYCAAVALSFPVSFVHQELKPQGGLKPFPWQAPMSSAFRFF